MNNANVVIAQVGGAISNPLEVPFRCEGRLLAMMRRVVLEGGHEVYRGDHKDIHRSIVGMYHVMSRSPYTTLLKGRVKWEMVRQRGGSTATLRVWAVGTRAPRPKTGEMKDISLLKRPRVTMTVAQQSRAKAAARAGKTVELLGVPKVYSTTRNPLASVFRFFKTTLPTWFRKRPKVKAVSRSGRYFIGKF